MGNCFILSSSHSVTSSLSSSRSSSLCSVYSSDSCPAAVFASKSVIPRRILPFSTPADLGARYQLGPELGRGQFGVISRCRCRFSGTLFACKSISKLRLKHLQDILREVRIMQRLSRVQALEGGIVRLHQVVEDASHVHLIMELCNGGELFDRVVKKRCCSESQAAAILKSLMLSIQVCHGMGIMHRDIKPENILLVDDSDSSPIRLADFGLALEFSPGQKFTDMAGSAYYVAPEVLQGEYSQEIDVWSAGVVLYVMLSGVPPFWGDTEQDIFDAICKGKLEFSWDLWHSISFSAQDLIRRMLCTDVKSRLTTAQVLEHPWILVHTKASKQTSQPEYKVHKSIGDATTSKEMEILGAENVSGVPEPSPALPTRPVSKETICLAAENAPAMCTLFSAIPTPSANIEQEKVPTVPLAAQASSSTTLTMRTLTSQASYTTTPTIPSQANEIKLGSHVNAKTITCIGNEGSQTLYIDADIKTNVGSCLITPAAKLFNVEHLPMPELLAEISVQDGWSCALLSDTPTQHIFAVGVGKESYWISYNKGRKVGWKVLFQHPSSLHLTAHHQSMVAC